MSGAPARDVAIVGGGPAGLAAAIAAARGGARTLLIDRGPRLGGNVANAFVHTICGLYEPADDEAPRRLHAGLPRAVERALRARGDAGEPERAGRVHVLPIRPSGLERLAHEWLEAAGVELALAGELVAATGGAGEDDPFELTYEHGGASHRAAATIAIDASGDGDLAQLVGADTQRAAPRTLQHASYIVRLHGLAPWALAPQARMQLAAGIARAVRDGALPGDCGSASLRPGEAAGEAHMTLTLPKPDVDAFDPTDAKARAELGTRAAAASDEVLAWLRANREGFERAGEAEHPARIGVREGRRVVGRVELDADHVREGRRAVDEVARACWPIELWHDHRRARFEHVAGPCSVPLGALVARDRPRLGMAGRCLSATHEALGSLRVVGTALATGEAIGTAAALAAAAGTGLSDVAPSAVRDAIARASQEPLA